MEFEKNIGQSKLIFKNNLIFFNYYLKNLFKCVVKRMPWKQNIIGFLIRGIPSRVEKMINKINNKDWL